MSAEEAIKKAYIDGWRAGQREAREYILSFIEDHEGIPITTEDIANEINGLYKKEMNATIKGMGQ